MCSLEKGLKTVVDKIMSWIDWNFLYTVFISSYETVRIKIQLMASRKDCPIPTSWTDSPIISRHENPGQFAPVDMINIQ